MKGMCRIMLVAAFAASAIIFAPTVATAQETPFVAAEDSYVDSSAPSADLGSKIYFLTDNSPIRTAYLRFNVQNVTQFGSAKLKLWAESSHSTGFTVNRVSDNTWTESTIRWSNKPPYDGVLGSSGRITSGSWVTVDVSAAVTANGPVNFAITTTSSSSLKMTSAEGLAAHAPQLVVGPAPTSPSPIVITPNPDGTYTATSSTGVTHSGRLKAVGEQAVADLEQFGGGTVRFTAGTFDFASEYFKFYDIHDIVFEGAGMGATTIKNATSAAADTEPFNFSGATRVTIRDLTVSAGGPTRTTSDALDFDKGNSSTVERVEIIASRGRGIVFDGKNDNWTADHNTIKSCVINGMSTHGIEFLASSNNVVDGCRITNVGSSGIQLNKSSTTADQPNKKSSDNLITNNTIDQAGRDGIALNGGDRNQITFNKVTNSSDDTTGRDGIRLGSTDSVSCNATVVGGNVSGNTVAPPTQRYGLYIATPLCTGTIVRSDNDFAGNVTAPIKNLGTGTIFQ